MSIGRQLGFTETAFCIPTDEGSDSNNSGMLIEIKGLIEPDIFKQSMHQLYLKHPLLRASYARDLNKQRYFFQLNIDFNDITIDIFEYDFLDKQQGIEQSEAAINQVYKPGEALWRVYLLRETKENAATHFIVFGFHHAIIDGISQLAVVKDFVQFYQAIKQHQLDDQAGLEMTLTVDDMVTKKISWQKYVNNYDAIFNRYGSVKELKYEKMVSPSESRTKIILCDFDKAVLDKIICYSKQRGFKVTALLNACMLMAMYHVTGHNETLLQVAINLRPYTHPKVSDEMVGCYIQTIRVIMKHIDQYQTLDQLARDYQQQYNHNFNLLYVPPHDFSTQDIINSVHQLMIKPRDRFFLGPAISNWGRVTINSSDETFSVISIHRATGRQMGDSPFYLHIATINDQIQGAFNYAEPYLSQQTMQAIVDTFSQLIIQSFNK